VCERGKDNVVIWGRCMSRICINCPGGLVPAWRESLVSDGNEEEPDTESDLSSI
jgi:hypothetical protein